MLFVEVVGAVVVVVVDMASGVVELVVCSTVLDRRGIISG